MIGNLNEPAELFAEEVPAEELNAGENARVVNLFHYHKEPSKTHGVPCKFVVLEVSYIARLGSGSSHKGCKDEEATTDSRGTSIESMY